MSCHVTNKSVGGIQGTAINGVRMGSWRNFQMRKLRLTWLRTRADRRMTLRDQRFPVEPGNYRSHGADRNALGPTSLSALLRTILSPAKKKRKTFRCENVSVLVDISDRRK